MRLRTKFLLWILSLISVLVLVIGGVTVVTETNLLKKEMEQHHRFTVERLAKVCEESLYQSDVVLLNYFQTMTTERGFYLAAFLDMSGNLQAASDPKKGAHYFSMKPPPPASPDNSVLVLSDGNKKFGSETYLDLSAPVYFANTPVGIARLVLLKNQLDGHIKQQALATTKRMALILAFTMIFGALGAVFLAGTMVAPIQEIVTGMEQVAKGRLDPLPITSRNDELGWMGKEINKTIQTLKELEEMKRNFFSRITHDLRSPLIGIQGLVGLLIKNHFGPVTSDSKEALLDIGNFSSRLSALIDDLLTSSKLEAGREELHLSRFDLRSVVEDVSKFFLPLSVEKNIPLALQMPNTAVNINADRDKLSHVITNLVSNAYKFTKAGTVTIAVEPAANNVKLSVMDTGPGIPPLERAKVFDRFYRMESTKNVKGTGLGLFIVKSLLDLHQATIQVFPNSPTGTQFVITLPTRIDNQSL